MIPKQVIDSFHWSGGDRYKRKTLTKDSSPEGYTYISSASRQRRCARISELHNHWHGAVTRLSLRNLPRNFRRLAELHQVLTRLYPVSSSRRGNFCRPSCFMFKVFSSRAVFLWGRFFRLSCFPSYASRWKLSSCWDDCTSVTGDVDDICRWFLGMFKYSSLISSNKPLYFNSYCICRARKRL